MAAIRPRSLVCLSNSELRQEVVKDSSGSSRKTVRTLGDGHFPVVYDISQDDNQRYCQLTRCNKIVMRGGEQSGIMIDFINEIADAISEDYPIF